MAVLCVKIANCQLYTNFPSFDVQHCNTYSCDFVLTIGQLEYFPSFFLLPSLPTQLHSLGREHGKLKAAHFKMLEESHETASKLSEEAVAREKALEQQRAAEETCLIQETKLQSTIAQQSKLIDFLRKPTPPSRGVRFKVWSYCRLQ